MKRKTLFGLGLAVIFAGAIATEGLRQNSDHNHGGAENVTPEAMERILQDPGSTLQLPEEGFAVPENGITLTACTKDDHPVSMNAVIAGQIDKKSGSSELLVNLSKRVFKNTAQATDAGKIVTTTWQAEFQKNLNKEIEGGTLSKDSGAEFMPPVVSPGTCNPS
jgi:hypothetical protein